MLLKAQKIATLVMAGLTSGEVILIQRLTACELDYAMIVASGCGADLAWLLIIRWTAFLSLQAGVAHSLNIVRARKANSYKAEYKGKVD